MANTPDINTARYAFWGDSASELATLVAAKAAGITAATLLGSAPYVPVEVAAYVAPDVPRVCHADSTLYVQGRSGTPQIVRYKDPGRLRLIIQNLSATQTLSIGYGTNSNPQTAPVTFPDSVAPGVEWVIGADTRPIWAYFPSASESIRVITEVTD